MVSGNSPNRFSMHSIRLGTRGSFSPGVYLSSLS